jgi:hypothetical protein
MAALTDAHKKMGDKNATVAKLLNQAYPEKTFMKLIAYPWNLEMVIRNKPEQKIVLTFAMFDTWNKIKSKVEKLVSSDGICVVCCEQEKGKKTMVREKCCDTPHCKGTIVKVDIEGRTGICQNCCEYLCRKCYGGQQGMKCPVCRQCMWIYAHKREEVLHEDEGLLSKNCFECSPDDDDDDDDNL